MAVFESGFKVLNDPAAIFTRNFNTVLYDFNCTFSSFKNARVARCSQISIDLVFRNIIRD